MHGLLNTHVSLMALMAVNRKSRFTVMDEPSWVGRRRGITMFCRRPCIEPLAWVPPVYGPLVTVEAAP
ncbi:MAG: hypothetical protein HYR48_00110 [Gemmatimonadetes bacterium]|nr:hypothetical protein [Gemmatimonadota bacterium]